jgi:hypothetical protein
MTLRMKGRPRRWAALLGACGTACAHGAPAPEETFRQIQQDEAVLARASAERARLPACSAAACDADERMCGASEALCSRARALHDRDASARCGRARDVCTATREHARERCATQAP